MALNWTNKVDNVDPVRAKDLNDIAHAVRDLETQPQFDARAYDSMIKASSSQKEAKASETASAKSAGSVANSATLAKAEADRSTAESNKATAQADRAKQEADRASNIDAYTKGDADYLFFKVLQLGVTPESRATPDRIIKSTFASRTTSSDFLSGNRFFIKEGI